MTKLPNFITHYYQADRQPFLTLSDLNKGEDSAVFEALKNQHKQSAGYHRQYGSGYLDTRRKIEDKLRRYFVARGGRPIRKYPFYFVLGESEWFKGLVSSHQEIRVDISDLSVATTSFTFPDSYIALSRSDKPYYDRVFLLSELESVVSQYGLPEDTRPSNYHDYWKGDFEKYVEVQVWDDKVVQPFIEEYWTGATNRATSYG